MCCFTVNRSRYIDLLCNCAIDGILFFFNPFGALVDSMKTVLTLNNEYQYLACQYQIWKTFTMMVKHNLWSSWSNVFPLVPVDIQVYFVFFVEYSQVCCWLPTQCYRKWLWALSLWYLPEFSGPGKLHCVSKWLQHI